MSTRIKQVTTITFKSCHYDFHKTLTFLIVPSITNASPTENIAREKVRIPHNVKLADPTFYKAAPVDLLIGSGPTLSLFSIGSINLSTDNEDLFLQKTRLGWILGGDLNPTDKINPAKTCLFADLKNSLEKFWSIEEVTESQHFSQEEMECERHFKKFITRDKDGRYVVALPFRKNANSLGQSRAVALKRLKNTLKRFERDTALKEQYSKVLEEYLQLGHATEIPTTESEEGFYLPHHAVHKMSSNTTRLRVVFDGSAKTTSDLSLNQCLMTGPVIQDDLFTLVIRVRFYYYMVMADIEKMYRQFLVRFEDRKFQKFLWFLRGKIREFQLNTITFGLAPASFLAIRCLLQLAEDEGHKFPLAAKILKKYLYVDNVIAGANSLKEAREIYEQLTNLLKLACLNLRQWAASDPAILMDVNEASLDHEFMLNKDCTLKALGIYWKAKNDTFTYAINSEFPKGRVTKRTILSDIAKLFDPLGLLGPVILYAKCIMQELWQSKLDWDESVPLSLYNEWVSFYSQLPVLNDSSFERRVVQKNSNKIELHGFCDASEKGYGACFYVRSYSEPGGYQSVLLCSKSRVAPLKTISIPRLELCGAVLLANLYAKLKKAIDEPPDVVYFWSDSTIVLSWLRLEPNQLKTFVANRVSEIQTKTDIHQWRHVRTRDNPADALSRGQLPRDFLNNSLWLHGPKWLEQSENHWPNSPVKIVDAPLPETKIVTCLLNKVKPDLFSRFSAFDKLKRVVSYCLRLTPRGRALKGNLTFIELNYAEKTIIRVVQRYYYSQEINQLDKGKAIKKDSRLLNLDPFLDQEGLLRVGGRLQNSDLSFNKRHPMILPKSGHITDLIISHYHTVYGHPGTQTALYALRQKYWILDGRNQIKRITRNCVTCFRARPRLASHKMGNLPPSRVKMTRVFQNVGIDFCGPFYIKEKKHRNTKRIKIYVSVFICMSVKAIHLEVVSDLTADAFLAALKRFTARRGYPSTIHCDNATNFHGAKNQLNELYDLFKSESFNEKITTYAGNKNIEFHFIPPSSPHFGGLWEAGVKSYKHHLKRVASNSLFTFEQFNTLTIEIEAILNSRPLTPISDDINDLSALTPGHLLIGDSLMGIPEPDLSSLPRNRLSAWQLLTKIRQDFWKRWHMEYLNELNVRSKWQKHTTNPTEGMLVLLKEDNVPCMQWPLARIQQLHPGKDDIVRTVTLKTANNLIKRPVAKIAILPFQISTD